MITYQDLEKCGNDMTALSDIIKRIINDHQSDERYITGTAAGQFYRHVDPDLDNIRRLIYDHSGTVIEDTYTPDNRITSNYFYSLVMQTVFYLLGNGVSFDNPDIKKQLGGTGDFDFQLQQVAVYAACDGEGYAFADPEKGLVPMCYACKVNGNEPTFAPLYDETDGKIRAGLRYWKLAEGRPIQAVLYRSADILYFSETENGYKLTKKQVYNGQIISNEIEGEYKRETTVTAIFPIAVMPYINHQSALTGNRTLLFAYDVVMSGMVNKVDMNTLYWIIKNADGMSKRDDVQFVIDTIRTHVLHVHDDMDVSSQEINTNTEAYQAVLAELRKQIFTNFMCVDTDAVSAGNITATQIKTAYQNMDNNSSVIEACVSNFIKDVLEIKGFDRNEPFHFTKDKAINESERIQNITTAAPSLSEETTLKLTAETFGLIDEIENIKKQREQEEMELGGISGGNGSIDEIVEAVLARLNNQNGGNDDEGKETA